LRQNYHFIKVLLVHKGGVCFVVGKIIPKNVEVTNINSYVCYKVRKLTPRNKTIPRKWV
jgi:hypothetical protein